MIKCMYCGKKLNSKKYSKDDIFCSYQCESYQKEKDFNDLIIKNNTSYIDDYIRIIFAETIEQFYLLVSHNSVCHFDFEDVSFPNSFLVFSLSELDYSDYDDSCSEYISSPSVNLCDHIYLKNNIITDIEKKEKEMKNRM